MRKTSFVVKTDVLAAALKRMKANQRRFQKLNILIRAGAEVGELILEHNGNSKYAGMLTTINGEGDWGV